MKGPINKGDDLPGGLDLGMYEALPVELRLACLCLPLWAPSAIVFVTEIGPDNPDQTAQISKEDVARLLGFIAKAAPFVQKAKKRAAALDEGHKQAAERKRKAALSTAARLMKQLGPKLRESISIEKLAELTREELIKNGDEDDASSVRSIRRQIAKAKII